MAKRMSAESHAVALLALRPTVKGRPKKWENYSNREKAVALAYDVIQAVLAGVYSPARGYYADRERIAAAGQSTDSVKTLLERDLVQDAKVCVLGALYLSIVRFENKVTVQEYDDQVFMSGGFKRLETVFTQAQIAMMEDAFEQDTCCSYPGKVPAKAQTFGKRYSEPSDAVFAIMSNIIENDGEFKP